MRIKKIEKIILTNDEHNALNELWQKLRDLDVEDEDMDLACRALQGAIRDFLEFCYLD